MNEGTANWIKTQIQLLRDLRTLWNNEDITRHDLMEREASIRDILSPFGLTVLWVSDRDDYGIFSNEE